MQVAGRGAHAGRWPIWAGPALLYACALVPRLLFWTQWNHAGLLALPVVDAHTFDSEAMGLTTGAWPGAEPFWQAPLYSFFLGGIYRVAGHSWPAARLANALLGAGICLLTWQLGRRWLGETLALVAYGIAVFYGPLIYFEGMLLREILSTFLLLLWLLAARRAAGLADRPAARPWLAWGGCGALLGLAAVCRENSLILLAPALWWAVRRNRTSPAGEASAIASTARRVAVAGTSNARTASGSRGHTRSRAALGAPVALLLGCALALLPTTLFNRSREGAWIPISSSGGINFYLGNNAASRETIAIRPGRFWMALVDRPRREAAATTASARSSFFYRESARWIRSHPLGFLGNTLYKTAGLLSAHETRRNQDIYEGRQGSWLLRLLYWKLGPFGFPFGILGPLALLGIFLAFTSAAGRPEARFLAVIAAFYSLGVILFFPNARYRVPLLPLFILLATSSLPVLAESARGRLRGRRRLIPLLALAGAIVLVDGGWVRAEDDPADQHFLRATTLAEAGRTDEAVAELQRATRLDPKHEEAWTTLAGLYGRAGRPEESIRAARAAIALDSTDAQAWVDLGAAELGANAAPAAEEALRRASALDPDLPDVWVNLGLLHSAENKPEEAERCYRHAISLQPGLSEARANLAALLVREGKPEGAREVLREGLRAAPGDGLLWFALGNLEGRAGNREEALSALERAVRLSPDNADIWNNYGLLLAGMNRRREALEAFDRALRIQPGHPQAAANRRRLAGSPGK